MSSPSAPEPKGEQAGWATSERGWRFRHGSLYGYRRCGCRCDLCRAAGTEYQRTYQRAYRARARLSVSPAAEEER